MNSSPLASSPVSLHIELLDLNDDCLLAVLRKLSLNNLNSTGLTCRRLRCLVNMTYKHHDQIQCFDVRKMAFYFRNSNSDDIRKRDPKYDHQWIQNINGYLNKFGKIIEKIEFNELGPISIPSEFTNEILTFILGFCSNALKSVKLHHINILPKSISNAQEIFSHLTKLDDNEHLNWVTILPMCRNLETLLLEFPEAEAVLNLNYDFPKLKTFHFKFNLSLPSRKRSRHRLFKHFPVLENFIRRHQNLNKLSINHGSWLEFKMSTIVGLNDLRELCISAPQAIYPSPTYALRKFEVQWIDAPKCVQLLQNTTETMEHLALGTFNVDQIFIDALSRFRNLHYLKWHFSGNGNEISFTKIRWEPLRRLNFITELDVAVYVPPRFGVINNTIVSKLMDNLILNNFILKKLTLEISNLDRFSDISQLIHLESFYLTIRVGSTRLHTLTENAKILDEISYRHVDWESFGRLTKIKDFHLCILKRSVFTNQIITNFLNNLGSRDALQKIHLNSELNIQNTTDCEIFQAIRNFPNLENLELYNSLHFHSIHSTPKIQNSKFDMLNSLTQMKRLICCHSHVILHNVDVINFVKRNPRLSAFVWCDEFVGNGKDWSDVVGLREKLADVVKNRKDNRHLRVNLNHNILLNFPIRKF